MASLDVRTVTPLHITVQSAARAAELAGAGVGGSRALRWTIDNE